MPEQSLPVKVEPHIVYTSSTPHDDFTNMKSDGLALSDFSKLPSQYKVAIEELEAGANSERRTWEGRMRWVKGILAALFM
eukprot:108146-Hanusia_phi.AAC.1